MSSPTVSQRAEAYHQPNWHVGTVNNIYQAAAPTGVPGALRRGQEELLRRQPDLAGRDAELGQLDRLLDSPRRHHFVWGPSGFGKSALLAHWIRHRPADTGDVCFHFINRLQATAGEEAVLLSLCEQLAAAHGLGDTLALAPALLRPTFADLLRRIRATATRLIIVVDGLDEAMQWSPGGGLFPAELPEGTDVFFSARADNEEQRDDWLRRLGLDPARVDCLPLAPLTADNIAALLRAAGPRAAELAASATFVREVHRVSNGDPFYLRFLAEDIQEGRITTANVASRPRGLDVYLQEWTSTLYDDTGVDLARDEVYALLGVLISAHGPLKPAELAAISPHLRKGALLDRELRGSLRRYLAGSRASGYTLCHPRFRDFLCSRVLTPAEVADHRSALLEYCRRWREHRGDYALDHFATHLEEAGADDELFALIDAEWYQARRAQSGSPRRFGDDVERALRLARAAPAPDPARIARFTLLAATATSVASNVSPELLGLLARLGGARSAWDYARFLADPLRRRRAYLLIGDALTRETGAATDLRASDLFTAATDLAASLPESDAQVLGLVEVATTLLDLGNAEAARALLSSAEARVLQPETPVEVSTLVRLAALFRRIGEVPRVQSLLARIRLAAQDSSDVAALALGAELCTTCGDAAGAADFARWTQEAAGKTWMLFGSDGSAVARALRWAGATAELESWINSHDLLDTHCALAEIELAAGETAAAIARATRARERIDAPGSFDLRSRVDRLAQVTRLFLRIGEMDTARALAREARETAVRVPGAGALGVGSPSRNRATAATLLRETGESAAAADLATESIAQSIDDPTLTNETLVDLIALARVLQHTGNTADARAVALRLLLMVGSSAPLYGSDPLFPLVDCLQSLGEASHARQLVERRLYQGESTSLDEHKALALAPLLAATPPSAAGGAEVAAEIEAVLQGLDALPVTTGKARALGELAAALAATDHNAQLDSVLRRILSLPATPQAIALARLALHYATSVHPAAAARAVAQADAALGAPADDDLERRRARLALTQVRLALGHRDEAAAQARSFLALGVVMPMTYPLAADSAWLLALAGDPASALPQARDCLSQSCKLHHEFITRDLRPWVDALVALQETPRARELVRAAARAVEGQQPGANGDAGLSGLVEVLTAALVVGDPAPIQQLGDLAAAASPAEQPGLFAAIAQALADAGRRDEAGDWAERAWAQARRNDDPYWNARHWPAIARTLAAAGRAETLAELRDGVLARPEPERLALLPDIIPAFSQPEDLARFESDALSLTGMRHCPRACVSGSLAFAFAQAGLTDQARMWSARALAEFDAERDGATTPTMLPHLVPMLAANRDRAGLLHLLRMPAEKRPYPREWRPLLQAVLPALAELGHIEIDSPEIAALRGYPETHGDVLAAIGQALVRADRLAEAKAAIALIKSDDRRAEAWLSFIPLLAARGRTREVDEILGILSGRLSSLSSLPARLGALAVAWARFGSDRHFAAFVKQRFLALPAIRLVEIDPTLLFHATRALAVIDPAGAIKNAQAVLAPCDESDQRGQAGAALARALAETGHVDAALPLARDALAAAGHLPAAAIAALAVFAQAGQWAEAQAAFLQALQAARPLGRDACLEVIANGARLAAAPGVSGLPLQLWRAIQQADRVWTPPAT